MAVPMLVLMSRSFSLIASETRKFTPIYHNIAPSDNVCRPWTSLPESVQNVLSIKFPGSELLVLKVEFGVEDLKALPIATPARP